MTDKQTPTDAELKALWQLHAPNIGGIFYYARAVLAKWGTLRADKIVIPTDTMEQEFQQHYRRGYEAGKKASTPQHTQQPAPAQAAEPVARLEIESLKAQLHAAKQINAAQFGLLAASIPGSALRASRGQAPVPPPECETEAEKRAFAFGWFKALESERMKADSVQEDAARYLFLRDGKWRDTDLEPVIRLQLNSLWDAKIDAAIKQGGA